MSWSDSFSSNVIPNPVRKGTWRTVHSGAHQIRNQTWQSRLEKVAPFVGAGSLSAVMAPKITAAASLSGAGSLGAVLNAIESRLVGFSGEGLPTGFGQESYARTVQLNGEGNLSLAAVDGLTASVLAAYPAFFSGDGSLTAFITGGTPPPDGLSASVHPLVGLAAAFGGAGALSALMQELEVALGFYTGSGSLTATAGPASPQSLPAFAGAGTLSASAAELYNTLASLAGSGSLTATDFASYARAMGLSGVGALTAALFGSYSSADNTGGSGAMSAVVSQIYSINVGFGD